MNNEYTKKLIFATAGIFIIFLTGILGYMIIEEWNFLDSIFMTVITLATIGYGETHPLTTEGRIFTICLILSGIGIFTYALGVGTSFIIEGEFFRILRVRRMEQKIAKLRNHLIVCGAGNTGRWIIEELIKAERAFVVIDSDEKNIKSLSDNPDVPYIIGDASKDATLMSAGIEHAASVVTTLSNDKDNLFVVLTARGLNKEVKILTKVIDEESEKKLKMAGADGVVSPTKIGGLRLASIMLRPSAVDFLDKMLRETKSHIRVDEAIVYGDSEICGHTLEQSKIAEKTGLLVVAIKKASSGDFILNPPINFMLKKDDVIIVMGEYSRINQLKKMANNPVT